MGSDAAAVVVGELPLLPPLKTTLSREKPAALAAASNCEAVKEVEEEEEEEKEEGECVTPRSEEHVLKPATVCPPPPRKPRLAKRTAAPEAATKGFQAVPRDLTSIFLPLPPKKRIRVG